jgi:hypothetical protein
MDNVIFFVLLTLYHSNSLSLSGELMDPKKSAFVDPDNIVSYSPADTQSRRGFLGGVGAISLAAMAGMMDTTSAQASPIQASTSATQALSSIDKINVIRDEKHDVPGGTEQIVQYTVSDDNGTTVRHSYNYSRIKQSGAYTISSNFRIEKFASGQPLTEKPASTKTFQLSVYGVEGEVSGNRRRDTVTTTIVADDGTVKRQTQVVPVRLDVSEFEGLDTAALIAKMGNIHLGKEALSR